AAAETERPPAPLSGMSRGRSVAERMGRRPGRQRTLAVDRLAHRVDDPAEPARLRADRGRRGADDRPTTAPYTLERRKRHQQRIGTREAHNLAGDCASLP